MYFQEYLWTPHFGWHPMFLTRLCFCILKNIDKGVSMLPLNSKLFAWGTESQGTLFWGYHCWFVIDRHCNKLSEVCMVASPIVLGWAFDSDCSTWSRAQRDWRVVPGTKPCYSTAMWVRRQNSKTLTSAWFLALWNVLCCPRWLVSRPDQLPLSFSLSTRFNQH